MLGSRVARVFLLGFTLVLLATPVLAQLKTPTSTPTPTPDLQEVDPDDVISVNTTEVSLPVTCSRQRWVTGQ